jgi:hypothetical protein
MRIELEKDIKSLSMKDARAIFLVSMLLASVFAIYIVWHHAHQDSKGAQTMCWLRPSVALREFDLHPSLPCVAQLIAIPLS